MSVTLTLSGVQGDRLEELYTACRGSAILFSDELRIEKQSFETEADFQGMVGGQFQDYESFLEDGEPILSWVEQDQIVGGFERTIAFLQQFVSGSLQLSPSFASDSDNMPSSNPGEASSHGYDYDVVIIGGGSGGLACSREIAKLGGKVAVFDFVQPSPFGSKWGLGGTCVNVGCIPKKLMHTAALVGETIEASRAYGWSEQFHSMMDGGNQDRHSWSRMVEAVQTHIKELNFGYRVALKEENVTYLNKYGTIEDEHTVMAANKKGKAKPVTAARIVVAVGGRPTPLFSPKENPMNDLTISSDDLFSMESDPGKVLVVGASYVALECAGFLNGIGRDVTVAVRSILLRGFDQEIAERIGEDMAGRGVHFKRGVTVSSVEGEKEGEKVVTFSDGSSDTYNTILVAVGRTADTASLNLDKVGIETNPRNGKVRCSPLTDRHIDENGQEVQPHFYFLGDVVEGRPELTPVAIQSGRYLARRLFPPTRSHIIDQPSYKVYGGGPTMNYDLIPTAVFTPLEYGAVGLSEDEAVARYGERYVDAYMSLFKPLEWDLPQAADEEGYHPNCFMKVVVRKLRKAISTSISSASPMEEEVLGVHILSPNAGEIIQSLGIAMNAKLSPIHFPGASMDEEKEEEENEEEGGEKKRTERRRKGLLYMDVLRTVGIHPTIAEEICGDNTSRSCGLSIEKTGC